ncbi:hypothetical protein L6452_11415 [Arctium lappa]|uniref:Uncharacterized protein n=1 Tax=Arctium lappa TaxID=4217 RepID=A0ACB9DPC1_ARCLA|nr:hypothetical protein L6452_11415 [Arctium lappa]
MDPRHYGMSSIGCRIEGSIDCFEDVLPHNELHRSSGSGDALVNYSDSEDDDLVSGEEDVDRVSLMSMPGEDTDVLRDELPITITSSVLKSLSSGVFTV